MDRPKISIIVPVYNVALFLGKCIDSLIRQTFSAVEIIMINDGSTDGSGRICDEYAKRDPRVKVLHQANSGPAKARNEGLLLASGEYVMYVDADDWLDTQTCEKAIKVLLEQGADVVFWDVIKAYDNQKRVKISLFGEMRVFEDESIRWLHRRMVGMIGKELVEPTKTDALNAAWGKLYRKDLLVDHHILFYDTQEIGSEDVLFNIHVFNAVEKAVYIPCFFSYYRQNNANSLTKNHKSTLFNKFLNLFSYIQLFIDEQSLPDDYQLALNNRIALSVINIFMSISNPNNEESSMDKIRSIKEILIHPLYRAALKQLPLTGLRLHWKLFFLFCKRGFATGVYVLAVVMRKLRKGRL